MASSEAFRTRDELKRAQWAEKYLSVTNGKLYTNDVRSPFPLHPYFQNKLLGPQVKMLEVNAGLCIVQNMTADTLTDLQINAEKNDDLVAEFRQWQEDTCYFDGLEEAMGDWFGVGYGVRQPFRTVEDEDNGMKVVTIDPSTWYPDIPALVQQDVSSGRIISVFDTGENGVHKWFALVENHEVGKVSYELYSMASPDALEGKKVALTEVTEFADLKDGTTDLDYLAVFQRNRKKSSRYVFGRSILADVWDMLQEVTENQTRIRHECIKHAKAKMYADRGSLMKADSVHPEKDPRLLNSKELSKVKAEGSFYDASQDIFPVPNGGTIPGYIQRDLQFIEKGSAEIDKQLSRIAAIVGCPKSIFNIDDAAGNLKVDTEKRKDRRYVRQILQAQKQAAGWVRDDFETWCIWVKDIEAPDVTVTFTSPFAMSQEETVTLMREMNPAADFVSRREAIKRIFPDMKDDEVDAMIQEIEDEQQSQLPPTSALGKVQPVQLQ